MGVKTYNEADFISCAENREIPFLYYKPNKEVYVIQTKAFVDTISKMVNETLNINEIANYLEIDISEQKQQKVNGQNIGIGFEMLPHELEFKIFGIVTHESSNIYNDDSIE